MKLTYLGHSGFTLELADTQVMIDPFITGNPLAVHQPETFHPSHIILTHAHGDHVGDTESIAKRSDAEVISSFEIVTYLSARGLSGHGMNPGGGFDFPFGRVSFTPAWHSSSFPDGTYGGMPMGVVIASGGKRLYHAGDTALFSDMALIGRKGLDAALLPIGDNFTMGPEDALEAVKLLNPKVVIPIHYNTFELIEQDAGQFKAAVESQTNTKCVILKAGDAYELS
jgi:L-ascorbate metabolism protein UlaG (beta-lactamase superfamily)